MDAGGMTDEQLAGQRLMVGFDGRELSPELKRYIERFKIGGVILFSRNIESPVQLRKLCSDIRSCALKAGQPPLFIAIDQEGGVVARLKKPFTVFPGNPAMKTVEDAFEFADITAAELAGVGVNMNMAPVMDTAPEGFGSIMADRAFGADPLWVSRLGGAVVERLQRGGVMAVAKHFPGIGRTTLDSHLDLPHSDLGAEDLLDFELIPFRAAIEKDVAGVMLSHIRYDRIDDRMPASLSTAIARDMLRKDLGFRGLAITDDLDMGAIAKHFDMESAVSEIFAADIDIALICHQSPKIETAFNTLSKEIRKGGAARKKASGSVGRISRLKNIYLL